jgi:hypothetical protein
MNVMPRLHVKPATRGDYTPEEIAIQAGPVGRDHWSLSTLTQTRLVSHHAQMRREEL